MRVLWLSSSNVLSDEKGDRKYNGKGWISSLLDAVRLYAPEIKLSVAFVSGDGIGKVQDRGVTYYGIKSKRPSGLRKLAANWSGGYRENYDAEIAGIVESASPDIVHVFGCESRLASGIASIYDIPLTVHLQGILSACETAFFPPDMEEREFLTPGTFWNEAVLRNGYLNLRKDYSRRAVLERSYLAKLKHAMGRTHWDRAMLSKYSTAEYSHVDEVLRPAFYGHAGEWRPDNGRTPGSSHPVRIVSTISEVPYKGLDVILKTASILDSSGINAEWSVAGIAPGSPLVKLFVRKYGVSLSRCRIRLLGVLSEEKLASLLLCSDIYVHPSYMDNSPNSLCEAQMTGIPVIASDTGGIPSLVTDGDTGMLFPVGNAEALAGKIMETVRNSSQSAQMGLSGYRTASERHDRRKVVSELMEAYRKAL